MRIRALLGALAGLTMIVSGAEAQAMDKMGKMDKMKDKMGDAASYPIGAMLSGTADGNAMGKGMAHVRVKGTEVCYNLMVEGTDTPTAAHIHKGAEGKSGPPVVTLKQGDKGWKGCTEASAAVAADIAAHPDGYYVNVHSAAHPGGAVRGQLHEMKHEGMMGDKDKMGHDKMDHDKMDKMEKKDEDKKP